MANRERVFPLLACRSGALTSFAARVILSADIYNQVRNSINAGEYFVNGAAQGMVSFAQNNIINGAPGLQWHQDFYDSVRPINVPTIVGPAGYTKCAGENQTCSFTGRASVAYGANNVFNYADASNSILCSNSVFGDPLPGVAKSCFYRPIATGPAGYTLCAAENQTCSFNGSASVAYGANNIFNYLPSQSVAVSIHQFGITINGKENKTTINKNIRRADATNITKKVENKQRYCAELYPSPSIQSC